MKKNSLCSLLMTVFMVLSGSFLYAYDDSESSLKFNIDTDYEYDDIAVTIEDYGNNLYEICVENNSSMDIYIEPDSVIYSCDSEGNTVGDPVYFENDEVTVGPDEYWPYTNHGEDEITYTCYLIIEDSYGNSYNWNISFGYYEDNGEAALMYYTDSDYFYDDIETVIEDTGNNTYVVYLVNNSDYSIYINSDSKLYECDREGNPLSILDTLADDVIEIESGKYYYYAGRLNLEDTNACEFIVLDCYDYNTYYFDIYFQYE